jgi:hypothetical protein
MKNYENYKEKIDYSNLGKYKDFVKLLLES